METNSEVKRPKILLVDDEEDILELLAQTLSIKYGYEVVTADNGTVGFLKAKQFKPDLIVLDIMMPIMDGFEVQRLLKEYEPTRNIPVLFLTGMTILEYKPLAFAQGAVGYLKKPVDEEELAQNVELLLAVRKLSPQTFE